MKPTVFEQQRLNYFIEQGPSDCQHLWGDDWLFWNDLNNALSELLEYREKSRILADMKEKFGTIRLYFMGAYDGTLKSILQPSVRRNFDWYPNLSWIYGDWKPTNKFCQKFLVSPVNKVRHKLYKFIREKLVRFVNKLLSYVSDVDMLIAYPHLPFYNEFVIRKEEAKHPIMFSIDKFIREHIRFIPKWWIKFVQERQFHIINEGYQKVALKYPHIVYEIIVECDLNEVIKPYGPYTLDGHKLWLKYWEPVYVNLGKQDNG